MSAQKLGERQIIGNFYNRLNQESGSGWVNSISFYTDSDQESEEYGWLGQVPTLREWIGGRQAKGLIDHSLILRNKDYEASIDILQKWIDRDKTGQVNARINDLADRANSHWASLSSTLILNGASNVCYDGQYFFDTDHAEGDSGTQDNDITVDISELPVTVHGTNTAPSVEEMQQAILKGVTQIQTFVDDQGEPMNENASSFLVMVPSSLSVAAMNALAVVRGTGLTEQLSPFSIELAVNPRLSSWTDRFAVFRTGTSTGAIIRQEEKPITLSVKGPGSDYHFDNNASQYGIDTRRTVGYGMWQEACLVTLV